MWNLFYFGCHRQKNAFGLWGVSEWYCLLLVNKPPVCSSSLWNLPSVIRAFTRGLRTQCEMRTCEQLCRAFSKCGRLPPFLRWGTVVGPAAVGWVCGTRTLRAAWFSVVAAGLGFLYHPWSSPGQVLEWVAFPFSRGSSQPRNGTQVSCIAGGFFTSWATREAPCACGACEMWLVWTAVFSACKVHIRFQKLHLMNIL